MSDSECCEYYRYKIIIYYGVGDVLLDVQFDVDSFDDI